MKIKELAGYAMVGALALGLTACGGSARQDVSEDYKYVNSIEGFEQDPNDARAWLRPGMKDVDQYKHFHVAETQVVYANKEMEALDPEQVARVQAYFTKAVKEKLQEAGYSMVDSPQDDTLTLKLYITGLSTPSGAAANTATALMIGVSTVVGEVTVETAGVDSATGEVQWVAADSRRGSYVGSNPWSSWDDIEDAMDDWAEDIRQGFDQVMEDAKSS